MPSTHNAVFLANGDGTAKEYAAAGAEGGHIIKNDQGTAVTARPYLQFNEAFKLADSSVNDATVVQADNNVIAAATNLGSVESSSTASVSHSAGELFVWQGQLVKANSAIAAAETISGKVTATTLNAENSDIDARLSFLEEVSQIVALEV